MKLKNILLLLILIFAVFLTMSAINATDVIDDLNDYELKGTNTVEIQDHGKVKFKLNDEDCYDLTDGNCNKIIKTKKNYKLKKTPTKKTKKLIFKSSQSIKHIKKSLKTIKKGKGTKNSLACQFYNNYKQSKILNKHKIVSYKIKPFNRWVDSPAGMYYETFYKVIVKYKVCKVKKIYKPLKIRIHLNYNKLYSDDYPIGYVKYTDANKFTYKYYFDTVSDGLYFRLTSAYYP